MQGFLNEEAVTIAADVYTTRYNVRARQHQQRIIPGINFTCNGTLTKWIIGARRRLTQPTNPQYLQLQIWRQQGYSNTYDRTTFSNITALNTTDDLNVYEYVPNPPLEFRANDILGLYYPPFSDTEVVVYYQWRGGPQNFRHLDQDSPLTNTSAPGGGGNDLPLVAVEVDGKTNFLFSFTTLYKTIIIALLCYVFRREP